MQKTNTILIGTNRSVKYAKNNRAQLQLEENYKYLVLSNHKSPTNTVEPRQTKDWHCCLKIKHHKKP